MWVLLVGLALHLASLTVWVRVDVCAAGLVWCVARQLSVRVDSLLVWADLLAGAA